MERGNEKRRLPYAGEGAAALAMGLSPLYTLAGAAAAVILFPPGAAALVAASLLSAVLLGLAGRAACGPSGGVPLRASLPDILAGALSAALLYPTAALLDYAAGGLFAEPAAVRLPETGFAAAWAISALAPAVSEELLCRGAVFGAYRKYGFFPAAAVSAIGFAAMHGSARQAAYALAMGLALAGLREASGSVLPCMAAHCAFNTAGTALELCGGAGLPAPGPAVLAAASCAGTFLAMALFRRSMARNGTAPEPLAPVPRVPLAFAVLAAGANIAAGILAAGL